MFAIRLAHSRPDSASSVAAELKHPSFPKSKLLGAQVCHEIGHTFGMKHCTFFRCLMQGSNGLDETDGPSRIFQRVKTHAAC